MKANYEIKLSKNSFETIIIPQKTRNVDSTLKYVEVTSRRWST